ncbi:autophagy protein Apg5-domain-containing protein [Dipodascopsis tothii]|uniref:autophagy protein Apg5-domain-containing protein n=1 Tax=Dipodascopsis tothii TaxID=44089 RepID=UPI0034CE19BF
MALRRKIWDGAIPVQVVLHEAENVGAAAAEPYYTYVRRLAYLPLLIPEATAYFRPLLSGDRADSLAWWFEFEGVPVKWHLPVGLLYDLLTGLDPAADADDWHLPWTLVLRHDEYPARHLLRLDSETDLVDHWVNRTKEADFLRRGTAKAVMSLSKDDSTQMWAGVRDGDYARFWNVASRLLPSDTTQLRHVPVRVYLPSSAAVVQAAVPAFVRAKEPQTLGTMLHAHLPELFPSRRTCLLARAVLHGVAVPLGAPLVDLLYEGMYTDGYLHVCIVMIA